MHKHKAMSTHVCIVRTWRTPAAHCRPCTLFKQQNMIILLPEQSRISGACVLLYQPSTAAVCYIVSQSLYRYKPLIYKCIISSPLHIPPMAHASFMIWHLEQTAPSQDDHNKPPPYSSYANKYIQNQVDSKMCGLWYFYFKNNSVSF